MAWGAAAVLSACLFTEFVGYWLHVLLHSEKVGFLSRSHMIHHLVVYAPNKPMRPSRDYLVSTYGRANVLGVGLEWLLPVALLLPAVLQVLRAAGVGAFHQVLFIGTSLAWGWFLFGYMHDAMHLREFWMEERPFLSRSFLNARKRHDIHHMQLTDDGRMTTNYGICFFLFDRLFGTLAEEHGRFNRRGLSAAYARYAALLAGSPGR